MNDAITRNAIDGEPIKFGDYRDEGLEFTTTTPYGLPIKWMSVSTLVNTADLYPDLWDTNQPALAYLRATDQDARVVLWWC